MSISAYAVSQIDRKFCKEGGGSSSESQEISPTIEKAAIFAAGVLCKALLGWTGVVVVAVGYGIYKYANGQVYNLLSFLPSAKESQQAHFIWNRQQLQPAAQAPALPPRVNGQNNIIPGNKAQKFVSPPNTNPPLRRANANLNIVPGNKKT